MIKRHRVRALLVLLSLAWNESALGRSVSQDNIQLSELEPEPENINQSLAQTLASVFSITIQDYFIASRWNQPGTANLVELRLLVPFKAWRQANLLRLNLPFRTQSELGPGLSDARVFDLILFETDWGLWGIGPIFNLGINRGPGIDTLQAGPVAAFVVTSIRKLRIGLLNQNLFSNQVALSTLQPIIVYQLSDSWTVGLGELPLVYNWNEGVFSVFSVGIQLGFLFHVAQQPIRLFVNPQYNTKSSTQLYQWTIASGVTLPLVPN